MLLMLMLISAGRINEQIMITYWYINDLNNANVCPDRAPLWFLRVAVLIIICRFRYREGGIGSRIGGFGLEKRTDCGF